MLFVHQADIMHEALVLFDEIGVFRVAGGDTLCMAAYSLTNDFNNDVSFLLPATIPRRWLWMVLKQATACILDCIVTTKPGITGMFY